MTDQTIALSPDPQLHAEAAALATASTQGPHTDAQSEVAVLSPRHERFVLEFLKDGNATRAYICAGYSARGAQPSASRLLRQPHIEAAIAAGQRRVAQALELSVERLGREYARIAFANIDDFVSVEDDGRLRVDLEKASQAQRAGIVELKISNHSKPEQQVTLKLGKLQALAALTRSVGLFTKRPEPAQPSVDHARYKEAIAKLGEDWEEAMYELGEAEKELDEAQAALAAAQAKLAAAGLDTPHDDSSPSPREGGEKVPSVSEADEGLPGTTTTAVAVEPPQSPSSALRAPSPRLRGEKEDPPQSPIALKGMGPPDPPRSTQPPPDTGPAIGTITWNTERRPPPGPTWHDIMRQADGFPRR